jgi:hypothetical protein
MDMKQFSLQDFAALIVRIAGVMIIMYSLLSLLRSPALVERSLGEDRAVDMAGATFVVGGRTFTLSARAGRMAFVLIYLIPIGAGGLLLWKSRFFGRLLCAGLE